MARSQHLTGEMVQRVVSFYEKGDEPINSATATLEVISRLKCVIIKMDHKEKSALSSFINAVK